MFTVEQKIDPNTVLELLVSAFDGGITYWAGDADARLPNDFDVKNIPWLKETKPWENCRICYFGPLVEGGSVVFHKANGEEGKWILDLESVSRGLKVMSSKYPKHWHDLMIDNADAGTADAFVQCCLFGKVIFG